VLATLRRVQAADSRLSWDQSDEMARARVLLKSGPLLPGLVIKRTVAERIADLVPSAQDTHMVCVHTNEAITLDWHDGGLIRQCILRPGDAIVNPAGYVEGRRWDERTEDVRVGFALDSSHLGSSDFTLRPAIGVHDPLIAQLVMHLYRAFEMGVSADGLYADALAHALGAHLVEHYNDRPVVRKERAPATLDWRQLEWIRDYIQCNLHRALTVTELAAVAAVSPSHFTRLFRQQTGEPPHRYVRNRRLDEAERLIVGSHLSLAAVAVAVGFSDQSHLNRIMRAERGITPGQLRNSVS
jgi:AraC family transcriptional regulator